MINDGRRVKVLDFGLAKLSVSGEHIEATASEYGTEVMNTTPGTILGTFAYMSPEQALGKEVDQRSDIFSLGVLLYELLAGRRPFLGDNSLAMMAGLLHAEPPALSRFNHDVTPELERIVHKLLEKDRERRYQGLREVYLDLDAVRQQATRLLASLDYQTNIIPATPATPEPATGPRTLSVRAGKSLAVMSFSNITRNSDDDWLGIGIAETVTADLKNIEGVMVIGRERMYEALKHLRADRPGDFDEKLATRLGREVGARWIVGGGYQRLGEMLRITARFVEVETGEVIKTVKIDGQMSQIFELQDKIVYELSRDLHLSLRRAEREVIEQVETDVIEAYEAFTKGMINLSAASRESLDRAILLFEKAITLDPNYARAYAALGYAYELKAQFLTMPELFERAITSLQKAIELRPMQAESYYGLGMTFIAMGREDEGIGAIRRALAFGSEDYRAHAALGRAYFLGKGLFREAAAEFEKALEINPQAGWVTLQIAHCHIFLHDYERAEKAARQAIELQEQYLSGRAGLQIIGAYGRLGQVYYWQGRYEDAIAEFYRELVSLRRSDHALKDRAAIEIHQHLASAYLRQGNLDDARAAFEQAIKGFEQRVQAGADDPFTRYYVACAYAMMGERDRALESLERAARERPHFTIERAKLEIDFESLRADARFRALVGAT
jgi:tetratricopeptide (TPR) repeat protein